MRDAVKTLISYPEFFFLIVVLLIIYASYLFIGNKYTSKIIKNYELLFVSILVILLFPTYVAGVRISLPLRLISEEQSFIGLGLTASFLVVFLYFLWQLRLLSLARYLSCMKAEPLMVLLTCVIFFSCLQSETYWLSISSAFAFLCITFFASQLSLTYSWLDLDIIFRTSLSILSFIGILLQFIANIYLLENGEKNLGILIALTSSLWIINFLFNKKNRIVSLFMIVIFSPFVFFTNTVAGIITFSFLILILSTLAVARTWRSRDSKIVFSVLTCVIVMLISLFSANYGNIANFFGKDPTLTGRTEIWEILTTKVDESPLGYGYNGFWGEGRPALNIYWGRYWDRGDYVPPHSHNGFIEISLQLGNWGLGLFLILFLKALIKSFGRIYSGINVSSSLPLIICVFLLGANIAETQRLGLIGPNYHLLLLSTVMFKLSVGKD